MNISEAGEKKGDAPKGRLYNRRSMKFLQVTSTRVAMRTRSSTLRFLLDDHPSLVLGIGLGCTAITTNSTGVIDSEIRYYPWETTRYTSGTSPTTFQYTGQRVESSLGLLFYNARWYDPSLGRFLQADSIVPGGVQGLDRYAYVGNNPLKYIDPTGHGRESTDCGPDGIYCDNTISLEEKYGISFTGEMVYWTNSRKAAVMAGVKLVAAKLGARMDINGANAWGQIYGGMEFEWDSECYNCRSAETITQCGNNFVGECAAGGAYTASASHIIFASMSGDAEGQKYRSIKNVVHEIGHTYDLNLKLEPSKNMPYDIYAYRNYILETNEPPGRLDWQQNLDISPQETFADMFIAWTYNIWNSKPENIGYVNAAQAWMSGWMP